MPTATLTRNEKTTPSTGSPPAVARHHEDIHETARQGRRVRRLRIGAAVGSLVVTLVTVLWVTHEWRANGALQSFGHEGNPGQWNPTLWALAVGSSCLIVGIMALRVHFRRSPGAAEIDRRAGQLRQQAPTAGAAELGRRARAQLEQARWLRFHLAAWVLGMIVLTPLWALIEWQDNGRFERWSSNSQRGDWEPWILYVAGFWAIGIAGLALLAWFRTTARGTGDRQLGRLRPHG